MKKITSETFRSPAMFFILYLLGSCLSIIIFRLIFPGEAPPLKYFNLNWRFLKGFIDIIRFFPALAIAGLVLPFALVRDSSGSYNSFSVRLFHQLNGPIATAICASVLYALVFFLALPLANNYEEKLRYKAELYNLAKERAKTHRAANDWHEAMQFIRITESIWPSSPDMAELKVEAEVKLYSMQYAVTDNKAGEQQNNSAAALPGYGTPVDAADAIAKGEKAFSQERYYDAHWFATLGLRLSRDNSIQAAQANHLAAKAWNKISSLEPDSREKERRALFRLKQSGYEAMVANDWIRAYYIFQELLEKTPSDPDAKNYFEVSEKGTREIAFFMDEMNLSMGHNLAGALFSLPMQTAINRTGRIGLSDRTVLRFSSLSAAPDYAYGTGLEYISYDPQSGRRLQLRAEYAKLIPFSSTDSPKVLILMKALDRSDQAKQWNAKWSSNGGESWQAGENRLFLDISYDDFLVLFRLRKGLSNLSISELFTLKTIENAGYIPQSLDAEIFSRFGIVLLFLPLAIAALICGWRFRAKIFPRYIFIPMFFVVPLVFNVVIRLYEYVLNNAGLLLIIELGFTWSIIILVAFTAIALFLFLMLLAAQKD